MSSPTQTATETTIKTYQMSPGFPVEGQTFSIGQRDLLAQPSIE